MFYKLRHFCLPALMVLLIIFSILLMFTSIAIGNESILFIANRSVPEVELSKSDIKAIYLGNRGQWSDGSRIRLATIKKSDIHKTVTRSFLKKTPSQFRAYWRKRLYTGEGKMPKSCSSEAALIKYVSANKGAIGYISSGKLPDSIKFIKITDQRKDGK